MKVLVVDDSVINLKVTSSILSKLNIEADTCLSGLECLELLTKTNYDLIFMDIMMPEMDGVETLNKIREKGYSMPIIALTADTGFNKEKEYLNKGFNSYVAKPITIDIIKDAISNTLGK